MLSTGMSTMGEIEAAVTVLEDNPLFNAGTGSTLNSLGQVEMDAAIMEGHTLRAGAVAAVVDELFQKDIAPVEKRLTMSAAGMTSSSATFLRPVSSASLILNRPRIVCACAVSRSGSLVAALQCLSERRVNLTRLEARPIPDKPFEYRFFLDFQVAVPAVAEEALHALEASTHEVRLFGTYPAFA